MEIVTDPTDHPKEYFYKITSNGRTNYYHRTANGHKRIAKAKIPPGFIDRIKPYNDQEDPDWLRQKKHSMKKIAKTKEDLKRYLNLYLSGRLSEKYYRRSVDVLQRRIKSQENTIKYCDKMNAESSERRYKEETGQYGGFKSYFKAKYGQYDHGAHGPEKNPRQPSRNKYDTLIEEGIIHNLTTPYKEGRKRYRRWLVKNHPDKGGDNDRCRNVISEFKEYEKLKR